MREETDWRIVTPGILVMMLAVLLFALAPSVTGRMVTGLVLFFFLGLCLTIAGSSDPNKGDK